MEVKNGEILPGLPGSSSPAIQQFSGSDSLSEKILRKAHEKCLPPLVEALIRPIIDAGGRAGDVIMLTESVVVSVMLTVLKPENVDEVIATFAERLRARIKHAYATRPPPVD
ncbi:MAG: hypothetical protein WB902_31270 [Acetobacteraceae bacterium]